MSAPTILVVDDDRDLRQSVCEALEESGYGPVAAENGEAALELLLGDEQKPSLILLDLMMPGMNGWQFRQEQVRHPELAKIPVVAMTATRDAKGLDTEVLFKPLKLKTLLETVERQVGKAPSAPLHGNAAAVLEGGGELGARLRAFDWSRTSIGGPEAWPQSLRSALSICLGSRFPIAIYWGHEKTTLYNDGWSLILGTKHPAALARPAREVWPEIWETVSGWFEHVTSTGESIFQENQLLLMHRHGYTEECYFDFTFTPIRGESGGIDGVFNAVVETTFRFINDRRTRVLRDLGEAMAPARTAKDAVSFAAKSLSTATHDVPFFGLYLLDQNAHEAQLVASGGLPSDSPANPPRLSLDDDSPWPVREAVQTRRVQVVKQLGEKLGVKLPGGAWPDPSDAAFLVPILVAGKVSGLLLLGANPRRAIDDDTLLFVERAASQVSNAIATAMDYEKERKRAEQLAELDRAKTTFFSNVSHEFRTPLTLMLGPADDLLSGAHGELGADQRAQVEVIRRNGLRLQKLVNALLEFSRLEAGRALASYVPTDLAALTRGLASAFEGAVERAGLQLIIDCPPLPAPVFVDRDMWEKIVLNLLSNALKFTFEGSIEVRLRQHGGEVELDVKDSGVGIPSEHLPRLFERFHRIEGSRSRTHEGSGIGLALVQELVRLHRGTVHAESSPGAGAKFTVKIPTGSEHLPRERVQTAGKEGEALRSVAPFVEEALRWLPVEPAKAPAPADESPATARVLLADDNADMRAFVKSHLERKWTVEAVADGAQALEAALARPPDLILTDVMMPGLNGFELMRALRENPRTSHIPIVMLSARSGDEAKIEGLTSGAEDYLTKPFSARELLARVQTHLELGQLRRKTESERNRLQDLLSQVPAVVNFLRGPDLVFEFAHPGAVARVGGRELQGKPLLEGIPELSGQEFPALLRRVLETGERIEGKEKLARLDIDGSGQLRDTYWNYVYLPVRDDQGGIDGVMTFDIEVTEQVLARQRLERSQEQQRLIGDRLAIALKAGRAGIFDWNVQTGALLWSNELFALLGLAPNEVTPSAEEWASRIVEEDRTRSAEAFELAQRSRASAYVLEVRMRLPGGSTRWLRVSNQLSYDEQGNLGRLVGSAIDIQDLKEAAERERRDRERAERATRFSELFVGIVGHDLRNPLSAITTAATVLEARGLDERVARPVSRILSSADRMERMISQLLDLSRIRLSGGFPLDCGHVDLSRLARAIADELGPVHERELHVESVGNLEGVWDADRLSQMFSNLVGNACQHGVANTPVRIALDGTKRDLIRVEIANQGVIPEGLLPLLFEPLRSNEGRARREGSSGLGLGLFITREIALAHGGVIQVESKPASGTRFIVDLPRKSPCAAKELSK